MMYNHYILEAYAKQRQADLLREAEEARLVNEAIKARKASMKKSENLALLGWRSRFGKFRSLAARWISQVFAPSAEAAESAHREVSSLTADEIHEAPEYI
jgi:hypothetical protein